jgi:hypothetical protein
MDNNENEVKEAIDKLGEAFEGFKITASSPKANALEPKQTSKYPFDELEVGKSFTAETKAINWQSLRTTVYQRNKKNADSGSKIEFAFIKHDDIGLCEVARIA